MKYLIVGLGNVGTIYRKTRHNIGFQVVTSFCKKENWEFKKKVKLKGYLANGRINEDDVYLLKPATFMNKSGISVKLCKNYFEIANENILVIADDVHIPFGEFRLKKEGSSGGHNGLLSVEENLKTRKYSRLRIGIGKGRYVLKDYVLLKFLKKEQEKIPEIIEKAIDFIYLYLTKGLDIAMNKANVRKK